MPRPSSIDRLPEAIRTEIGRLRTQGCTIDQILAHLRTLYGAPPSRSALGRHIKGLDKIGEQMRRSRAVAEALVQQLGEAPESQVARLNIELLHSALLDVLMKWADGNTIDEGGTAALSGDPEGLMFYAKMMDHLGRASKSNVEVIVAAEKRGEERGRTTAAKAAESVAVQRGLSAETIGAIKTAIFGVAA